MNQLLLIILCPFFLFGQSKKYIDSLDKANSEQVDIRNFNKLKISKQDSSIYLNANMRIDHRIFGYSKPDVKSDRLILLSIFTNDVENNPFKCKLGAYYEMPSVKDLKLRYIGIYKNFIKVKSIDSKQKETIIYFDKKFTRF